LARAMKIPATRFLLMDIEHLTFGGESFDAAVCGHGLQFVPDLPRALSEARRVLRSKGRLAASVPLAGRHEAVWALLDSVIDRWLPPAPEAVDQGPTRETVEDAAAFRHVALEARSEEHTSELQSRFDLVCRLLLEKKNLAVLTPILKLNQWLTQRRSTARSLVILSRRELYVCLLCLTALTTAAILLFTSVSHRVRS